MAANLIGKGCEPDRVSEFRNWADINAIRPDISGLSLRDELGIKTDEIVLLYSGNLSEKQGASILSELAQLLEPDLRLRVIICGDGPARATLAGSVRDRPNVTLLPLQPKERLPELLCAADIHLLPQLAGAEDLVLPSKLSGMLSSGRPTVATVTPESGISQEIGGGGLVVPPGDAAAMAEAVRMLAADSDQRLAMGRAARTRAEAGWAKEAILSGFEERLLEVRDRVRTTARHGTRPTFLAGGEVAVPREHGRS